MKKYCPYMLNMLLTLTLAFFLSLSVSAQQAAPKSVSCPEATKASCLAQKPPYCGDNCDNTPFCATNCATSSSGPAWSGGGSSSETYLLYCKSAVYANCHYSGPPWATGTNSDNIPLPCKLSADGKMAHCKCEVFKGESYVNITGIMNLGVYYETVKVCGEDGSKCQNMSNCPSSENGECTGAVPPVCKYVSGQNPNNPETSLIPGADLISTFGTAMENNYPSGDNQTVCSDVMAAGCMTAPCKFDKDDPRYAQCDCLTSFKSSYTLSQSNQQCDIGKDFVWE